MKHIKEIAFLLLLCVLLSGCAGAIGANAPAAEPPDIKLSVSYQIDGHASPLSSFNGCVYLTPRPYAVNAESYLLCALNTKTLKAERVDNQASVYLPARYFFTTDDYLYSFFIDTVFRYNLDGSERIEIPMLFPLGYNTQTIVTDNNADLYMINSGEEVCSLVKYDFENKTAQPLWEAPAYRRLYDIIAVCGRSFIIRERRRTDKHYEELLPSDFSLIKYEQSLKQFTLGQAGSELADYEGTALCREFEGAQNVSAGEYFTDRYTNLMYTVISEHENPEVAVIDINEDTKKTIAFDVENLDFLGAGYFGEQMYKGIMLLPVAATEDGFILQIGRLKDEFTVPGDICPAYGYISKEDYNAGRFNVTPFDYSVLLGG